MTEQEFFERLLAAKVSPAATLAKADFRFGAVCLYFDLAGESESRCLDAMIVLDFALELLKTQNPKPKTQNTEAQ